jgi:cytochrome P450
MNPDIHPDPDRFYPERYLNHPLPAADYINIPDANARDHFTYGAGRRICPGIHVAEKSLFINIVRTLWAFNLSKKKGPDGSWLEPDTRMVRGFLSAPNPFECEITPRSAKHAKVIRQALKDADAAGGLS